MWTAFADLGFDERIAGTSWPLDFAWPGESERVGVLAGRQRQSDGDSFQALLFLSHDTLAVLASFAPDRAPDDLTTWLELRGDWQEVRAGAITGSALPPSLGEAEIANAVVPA